ncbi:MAG: hypothetical protein QF632_01620 [Candidatus Woesearchaeota archaeon]|mgnify:CR=1 FL=1|jgi:hypothetical protein|nr:hypothetical protein [Candidatus Woesearchaeota archaeon]MDP7323441.1 hypothetical protein [Candidatus Woesearchaeota archaeon]MDP7458251.1 hypothetical protein [Candidatus Woesearchaeota archaeon]
MRHQNTLPEKKLPALELTDWSTMIFVPEGVRITPNTECLDHVAASTVMKPEEILHGVVVDDKTYLFRPFHNLTENPPSYRC